MNLPEVEIKLSLTHKASFAAPSLVIRAQVLVNGEYAVAASDEPEGRGLWEFRQGQVVVVDEKRFDMLVTRLKEDLMRHIASKLKTVRYMEVSRF